MYDYNFISEKRALPDKERWSWTKLGNFYSKDRRNVERWFNRQTESRAKVKQQYETLPKHTQKATKQRRLRAGDKLPKYGNLDPTNYKSGLSFQEWRVHYLGRSPDWILPYITEVEQLYFNCLNNYVNEMPFLFRDGGKTFIGMDFISYLICEYQNTALVITSGGGSKRRFYNAVKSNIKRSAIRRDYGDIVDYENKIDGEIWLVESLRKVNSIDPDLRVTGRGSDVIGAHPDLVFLEDFVQQPYKSNESEEGMRDWISEVVIPMNAPVSGTGTRKDPDDIYGWMAEQGIIKLRVWPALTSEGPYPSKDDIEIREEYHPKARRVVKREMIREDFDLSDFDYTKCPNYDLHSLLVRRLKNIRAFESEMMQRPIPKEGNIFDVEKFITFDTYYLNQINKNNTKIIWVDPAFGASAGSSDTAIIVTIYTDKLRVIDIYSGKYPKRKLIKKLHEVGAKHDTILVKLENDYSQITTRWDMSDFKGLNVSLFKSASLTTKISNTLDAKLQRINDMDVGFDSELIEFYEKCTDIDLMRSQYLRYNSSKGRWDLLDILASAYHSTKNKLINYNNVIEVF